MSGRQARPAPDRLPPAVDDRRLAALEAGLRDLAQDQRWLQEQIDGILDRIEDREPPATSEKRAPARGGSRTRLASDRSSAFWKRALRGVLRSTLGSARKLWQASDPAAGRRIRIELSPKPAARLPRPGSDYRQVGEAEPRPDRLELARLALAAEDLGFLEFPAGRPGRPLETALLVASDLWEAADGDPPGVAAALARRGRRRAQLGKVVGGRSERWPELRAIGDYRLPERALPYRHLVKPLDGLIPEGAGGPEDAGAPPAVLILLSSTLAGGREQAVADVTRELGETFDFAVVSTVASDALQNARRDQLERLVPRFYPLADYLPGPVLPSAAGYLARRHRAAAVVHLGAGLPPAEIAAALAALDPPPALLDRPPVCGLAPVAGDPREGRGALREALGVGDDQLLVVMASDLLPGKRPEDFLTLAHRFRDERRFAFVLAGRGPLEGTVGDLERYLAPAGFRRLEAPLLPELLAAADVACTPSEDETLPYFPLAALAAGLPVVAAAAGGLEELLAQGPCGIAAPVADLDAFEAALRRLTDVRERRRLGDNGPRLVARRFRLEDVMRRFEEQLRTAISARRGPPRDSISDPG